MAIKSRNKSGIVWSLFAIALAFCTLIYCASFTIDLFINGLDRISLATDYFVRIIRGGNA
ncbi:hypothetical protein CSV69_07160 [Sporosarcina sp. P26b]|nr:hypothetical protein SporoP32a_10665 [Sporosarcina ureae]PIC73573.1 hypothetical protein CSV76_09125 [Sporosarcina sp. P17b]PIC96251.1 hypothetical protein CSV69_07160 [Sporosarcina sp. P26b]